MKKGAWLRLIGFVLFAAVLAGCGSGGEANVQATVDAAVVATASAQGRLQATVDAAVAATQVVQAGAGSASTDVVPADNGATSTPGEAAPTEPPVVVEATATRPPETPAITAPRCEVMSAGLNLRGGPGTVFNPPLRTLPQGAALTPLSFVSRGFPSGQWIEVQVDAGGQRGWISAGAQFVACNLDVASLPAGSAPPTPTPRPVTATPPPATPTRIPAIAILPVDGGCSETPNIRNSRNVKGGCNVALPGFESYEVSNPMVFRDRIVFQVEVFDTNVGRTDGAGIDSVSFTINDSNRTVHQRTERNAGYCVFGGGEPDCTVWRFSEHGNRWPGGADLQKGPHSVQIVITPKSGEPVTWFWTFEIQ